MDRAAVYRAINSERDYQLKCWGVRQPDGSLQEATHTPGEFLLYMQHYVTQAITEETTKHAAAANTLDIMRKIVALGVACFEQHGVPARPATASINDNCDDLDASERACHTETATIGT